MCFQQFTNFTLKHLQQNNYVALSTLKKHLRFPDDSSVIRQSLTFRHQHQNLEILCLVTFQENNVIYTRYQVDSFAQQLVTNRKSQGKPISDIFVEFLCIFKSSYFNFNNIVQVMIDSTKPMYTAALDNQIQRNLTLIPPNAIMKNGKKYSEIHSVPLKSTLTQTASKASITSTDNLKKEPFQKTKGQVSDLPRMKQTKPELKQQEQEPKPATKKPVPAKKLQIQSDDSEDVYVPQKFMQVMDIKPIQKNQPMQIQNQGNYKENQAPKAYKGQKMQIQDHAQKVNKKQNSPGNNTVADDEDSVMDEMMEMMNEEAKKPNEKPSLGAKSLPAVKQTKLEFGKPDATKSVATKQGSLFGWMGKK